MGRSLSFEGTSCIAFVGRTSSSREAKLQACQPRLDACPALLTGPHVHRQRQEIIDFGDGAGVEREVDRLDVVVAGVAGFDAPPRGGFAPAQRRPGWIPPPAPRASKPASPPLPPPPRAHRPPPPPLPRH